MKGSKMYYTANDAMCKPETRLIINEAVFKAGEGLLAFYHKEYKERPKELLRCFMNNNSMRMAVCLILFTCRKLGVLKEWKGKKDFSEWVNKQPLEERWKPVLCDFLLILWAQNQELIEVI